MTTKTQITHLKIARYPELLEGPVRPIHWDVDPSSVCDHGCRGCPYIFDGDVDPMLGVRRPASAKTQRTLLGTPIFLSFLSQAVEHGAKAITFVGGGEPTVHPNFANFCRETYSSGLKFGVVTHLGREYNDYFFNALSLATWVRVSLNAASRETYRRHQQKDHFASACLNLARLADMGTRVGVSFLITNDNVHEIADAALLAKRLGAAYIQYKPIIEHNADAYPDWTDRAIRSQLGYARTHADVDFQVLDQWSNRLDELVEHAQGAFSGPCHVQRFNPKLGANGVVYSCCELAYSEEGAIGSIYDESLETILERAGQKRIDMAGCPHCWSKPANAIINEGRLRELTPPPESIDQEFV